MFATMFASLREAFASPVTWLVVVLCLGLVVLGVWLLRTGWQRREVLRRLALELVEQRASLQHDASGRDRVFHIRTAIKDADTNFRLSPGHEGVLLASFAEFEEQLLCGEGADVWNAEPASSYFRDDELLRAISVRIPVLNNFHLHFTGLHVLPNMLTGIGMLGTFVGIALGLSEISSLSDASAEAVSLGVGGVIVGLSSAFWTSIFGLGSALFFSYWTNHVETSILAEFGRVKENIDRIFKKRTTEQLLSEQLTTLVDAQESAARTASAIDGMGESIAGAIVGALRDGVEPILQTQAAEMARVRESTEQSVSELKTISEHIADAVASALQLRLEPVLNELTQFVKQQTSTAAQASMDGARDFVDQMVGQLSGSLQDGFNDMAGAVDRFRENFEVTRDAMADILMDVRTVSAAQRDAVVAARELVEQQQALLDGNRALLEQQAGQLATCQTLVQRCSQVLEQSRPLVTELAQLRHTISEQQSALEGIATSAEAGLLAMRDAADLAQQVAQSSETWSRTVGGALEDFAKQTRASLQGSLELYDESLSKAVRSLSASVAELDGVVESLSDKLAAHAS